MVPNCKKERFANFLTLGHMTLYICEKGAGTYKKYKFQHFYTKKVPELIKNVSSSIFTDKKGAGTYKNISFGVFYM